LAKKGPPDAIYTFNMINIAGTRPTTSTEKWPPGFDIMQQSLAIGMCGQYSSPLYTSDQCCINSIVPEKTGFSSTSYAPLSSSAKSTSLISQSANGVNYCILKSNGTTSNNVNGYKELYIREHSECIAGFYCQRNGILVTLPSGNCSNTTNAFASVLQLTSAIFLVKGGNVTASFGPISGASQAFKWYAEEPNFMLVSTYQENAWEFISVICNVFTLAALIGTISYFGRKYMVTHANSHLAKLFIQSFWLCATIINTAYIHLVFIELEDYYRWAGARDFLVNLATLFSAVYSCSVIAHVGGLGKTYTVFFYIFLGLLHLGFAGNQYTTYWALSIKSYWIPYATWRVFNTAWTLLELLLMFAPIAFLLYKVVIKSNANNKDSEKENGGPLKRLERLLRQDKYFAFLSITTVICIALYVWIRMQDLFLAGLYVGARTMYAFGMIRTFFQIIPSVFNCLVLEHLPEVIKHRHDFSNRTVEPHEKVVMLKDQRRQPQPQAAGTPPQSNPQKEKESMKFLTPKQSHQPKSNNGSNIFTKEKKEPQAGNDADVTRIVPESVKTPATPANHKNGKSEHSTPTLVGGTSNRTPLVSAVGSKSSPLKSNGTYGSVISQGCNASGNNHSASNLLNGSSSFLPFAATSVAADHGATRIPNEIRMGETIFMGNNADAFDVDDDLEGNLNDSSLRQRTSIHVAPEGQNNIVHIPREVRLGETFIVSEPNDDDDN
jgi:hypothetical protein